MKEGGRSEMEKERTRERERRRRSITTKIFHGLRRHGGYSLSPRADINEVLRELAREAGWIVEPDGTTYRSDPMNSTHFKTLFKALNCCAVCGAAKASNGINTNTNATPTSSVIISAAGNSGCGGELSTAASDGYTFNYNSVFGEMAGGPVPYTLHFCNEIPMMASSAPAGTEVRSEQQAVAFQEARASNTTTPIGSPLRCTR